MKLLWELLWNEGPAAVRDRLRDRLAGWRRRRSFRPADPEQDEDLTPVLNVLPSAPRPDWGGVQIQLLHRLEAEARTRAWALLYPDGDRWRLELRDGERRRAVALLDACLDGVVRRAARRVGARTVHFEQLVGFPLVDVAALDTELHLVISVHDFGLFCRRPHLMERPAMRFCGFSRDAARCGRCLRHDWDVDDTFQAERRTRAAALLQRADVVYPSDYLRRTYAKLFPTLDASRQHVVAPPTVPDPVVAPAPNAGRVRHLAYVGSVKPHKGALVFLELLELLAGEPRFSKDLRFTVYGGGDREILRRLRAFSNVRLCGYYRAGELPGRLRRDGVDLALLLSVWPETYALTLDECRLAGVPVVAFDHGAPAKRLAGAGVLVPPEAGAEGVAAALRPLVSAGWDKTAIPPFRPSSAPDAAAHIAEIYRGIARRDAK